jgi:uncharacterized low-complexity protein
MTRLTSIALASALLLGAAPGLAQAQNATEAPPSTQDETQDCASDAMGEGHDGCTMDRDGMGQHGMGRDGMGHRDGRHGDKHARWRGDRRDGHGRHNGERHMMRIIDVNADGIINDDEAASLADFAFMRMDQDRDGTLSTAEFTEMRGFGRGDGFARGWFNWGGKEEADAVLKVRKDKFTSLDADKNGSVSKAEFFADAKTKLAAADTDKDGKVTPWEFRANFPR